VTGVVGDPDHPVSRGYTCPKGRALGTFHHSPDRLDRPRLRGTDVAWDVLLDDLASALDPVTTGFYLATGFGFDSAAQAASMTWFAQLGSPQLYTAVTVDNAPVLTAAQLVTGQPMLNPVWDPEQPGLLLCFGINPVVSHGYGTAMPDPITKLRRYRSLGGQVWVLDPRRSHTAAQADVHLAVRPGSDVAVLAWLCRELLPDGHELAPALARFDAEVACAAAGVDVRPLLEAVRAAPGRLAVMCGTGLTMSRDGVLAEWLRWVLLALSGSLDVPTGMRFNRGLVMRLARNMAPVPKPGPPSRPELRSVIGQYPCVAMVDEIEAGRLRSLVVGGGNPLSAFPDKDRTRAALSSLDVLAVVDVADNELTAIATHVLPAAGQLERADLTLAEHVAVRSGIAYTPAVVPPAAERKPAWWIFGQLGKRMGIRMPDPDVLTDERYLGGMLGARADEVVAAGPHGVDVPHEYGWVARDLLPDGEWQLAPAELVERLRAHVPPSADGLVLVNRRDVRRLNSVAYAGEEAQVRLHPDDAPDADRVTVASAHGSLVGTIALDPTQRPGTVSVGHGRPGADVAQLTSATADVDPLTGMPLASGLPVTIAPAP
jgi:anaerobic selenocysteine-containing dehydrogenase